MGKSDPYYFKFCHQNINPSGDVALLGFTDNRYFDGDLYDLSLNNWDINSEWQLNKKYDTIISTRCPYFAKNPQDFIRRCHENLNEQGKIYVDWGLGDHWRFDKYKIGWAKDNEQEFAYKDNNFLWSALWDDSFLSNEQFKDFEQNVKKFGYKSVQQAVQEEVPNILTLDFVKSFFNCDVKLFSLWPESPQLYTLIRGVKL